MPFELFLALRYLRSRRQRRLARVTALAAVVGIAVGVASLIVALALSNGFRDEMREKILSGTAHITVVRSDGEPLSENSQLAKRVERIRGVTSAFATTYDGAVVVGPKGSAYAILRGLDTTAEPALRSVQNSIVEGSTAKLQERSDAANIPAVLLGGELAARTGLVVGDVADVIPASVNLSSSASTTSLTKRSVYVAGLFRSGLFEYDSTWIYLSLDTARRFSGADHSATVISVQLADIYDAPRVAAEIRSALGSSYSTIDWQDLHRTGP
jgi:lipoprotein-releasing system permease protein